MSTVSKKLGMLALGVACLFASGDAIAGAGDVRIGPKVGIALPMGDFGDFADLGFLFGATGDYGINETLGITGDLLYNPFSVDDQGTDADLSFSIIHVTGNVRYSFPGESSLRPFAAGGLGLYFGRSSVKGENIFGDNVDTSSTDSDFGLQFGGGIEVPIGESAVELTGLIHLISDTNMITFAASLPFSVVAGE